MYIKLRQRVTELEEEQVKRRVQMEEMMTSHREKEAQVRDMSPSVDKLKQIQHEAKVRHATPL